MNLDFDLKRIVNILRFEIVEILKNTIVPASCLILALILFVIFIAPYQRYSSEFESKEQSLKSEIEVLSKNKDILVKARDSKEDLDKVLEQLNIFVPSERKPAIVSDILQNLGTANNFIIDVNQVAESSEANLIEVRFNGRAPGLTTTANFLSQIDSTKNSLYAVFNLALNEQPDSQITRVSFTTQTIFDTSKSVNNVLTPIPDILTSENYIRFRDKFKNQ